MASSVFPAKSGIPSGNTAARPSNPVIGDTYYNGQLEILEIFNGTIFVAASAPPAVPTIATPTDVGTNLAYTTGGSFTVAFTAGSGGGTPSQYNAYTTVGGFSASSSSTTVSITGLTPATSFTVYGNAQNNFGTTVNTANASAVTATTLPEVRTIGTATASGSANEVTVTWTNGSNGGKVLSSITITPFLNGTTAETSRTAASISSTSYTFTEGQLTAGSAYTFKVKATNANGTCADSTATNSATMPNVISVDYLVIAGGGGGSSHTVASSTESGGGGGAGGMRSTLTNTGKEAALEAQATVSLSTNYSVVVGAGGSGGASAGMGTSGVDSTFNTITSTGGGRGGNQNANGANGGAGGGGGAQSGAGGTGTTGQGYGGGGSANSARSGGGGGAGAAGQEGTAVTGGQGANGGNGLANSITGSSVTYAGGGGSGDYSATTTGLGGSGGGGAGAQGAGANGTAGTANRGGGGGGTAGASNTGTGGGGGSGVVILRYSDSKTITIGAGLTGTESAASGGYKRATITAGSGNVSWA